eukprot:6327798-Prorocentrum_lima.AAC.1
MAGQREQHRTCFMLAFLKFWCWAVCQAAHLYRMQVLEMPLSDDAPTFGHRVLIAKPPREVHAFQAKMEEG